MNYKEIFRDNNKQESVDSLVTDLKTITDKNFNNLKNELDSIKNKINDVQYTTAYNLLRKNKDKLNKSKYIDGFNNFVKDPTNETLKKLETDFQQTPETPKPETKPNTLLTDINNKLEKLKTNNNISEDQYNITFNLINNNKYVNNSIYNDTFEKFYDNIKSITGNSVEKNDSKMNTYIFEFNNELRKRNSNDIYTHKPEDIFKRNPKDFNRIRKNIKSLNSQGTNMSEVTNLEEKKKTSFISKFDAITEDDINNINVEATWERVKKYLSDPGENIMISINSLTDSLTTQFDNNTVFYNSLIQNLDNINNVLNDIIIKLTEIFNLLYELNNANSGTQVNDTKIKDLLKIINIYIDNFRILEENFNNIKEVDTENQGKANQLIPSIDKSIEKLTELFRIQYQNIGIFNLGDDTAPKYYTYNQIKNKIKQLKNKGQVINETILNMFDQDYTPDPLYDTITKFIDEKNGSGILENKQNILDLMNTRLVIGAEQAGPVETAAPTGEGATGEGATGEEEGEGEQVAEPTGITPGPGGRRKTKKTKKNKKPKKTKKTKKNKKTKRKQPAKRRKTKASRSKKG
jgi:hypothetical protein